VLDRSLGEVLKEAFRCAHEHVVDALEAVAFAVVGVRDFEAVLWFAGEGRVEGSVEVDAVFGGAVEEEVVFIVAVHRDEVLETVEIRRGFDLPRDGRDGDAVACADLDGSRVSAAARVPVARAGGVDIEAVEDAALASEVDEDPLSEGRSADVAHAHEEDARCLVFAHGQSVSSGERVAACDVYY